MRSIEKRTILKEPILAWKVIEVIGDDFRTPYMRQRVVVGRWLQATPDSGKRKPIGGHTVRSGPYKGSVSGEHWGFHTYESKDAAKDVTGILVQVVISGRAAYGRHNTFADSNGWTAEWIYYLPVGRLAPRKGKI